MISSLRTTIFWAGIASVGLAAVVAGVIVQRARAPGRWFMPGPLGYERAAPAPVRIAVGSTATRRGDRPAAPFITRAIGLRSGEEEAWGQHNGVTPSVDFSHNLSNVFPPELAAERPEFFPIVDGRRFRPSPKGPVIWNPDLGRADTAAYAARRAIAGFKSNPAATTFSLGINDAVIFGDSLETAVLVTPTRWFRGRPDFSRLVFTFMNRAAVQVAPVYPDKYLACLAYYWCENVPPFAVDPHVMPFLCADRSQSYDPAFQREEFELQRRWAAALAGGRHGPSRRLGMYDYLDGYGFLVPRVPVHAFAEHVRHAADVGFTDYYGESSRNWSLDGPLPWIIAQLLLDPHRDVERLLDEYYTNYFREAQEPMRRFFARCEEQWMTQPGPSYWLKHYRNESQAALFPPEVCRELRELLDDAARRATTPKVKERVAFVSAGFGVTERFTALQHARFELGTQVLQGKLAGDSGWALFRAYRARRAEFIRYTHATLVEWPLAFFPINYDDFLRDDPGFAAALALSREANPALAPRDTDLFDAESVRTAFEIAAAARRGAGREILQNGGLTGPIVSSRRLSGLNYGIDLPAPWQTRVEPTEQQVGELRDADRPDTASPPLEAGNNAPRPSASRVLRIGGAENTTAFQWLRAKPGAIYAASAWSRGLVSNSDAVTLTLGWLNAKQEHIGTVVVMRLPDGNWPDWVQLQQGARAPADAAWAGFGIRVQHQVAPDWVEFREFSLREIAR